MKNNWRKALVTVALGFALASSAFADDGYMHTEKTQPSPSTNGIIQNGEADGTIHTGEALMEMGLSVLQGLLSQF